MTPQGADRVIEAGAELGKRYTLERKLGAGLATETWLARDGKTGSAVALKILVAGDRPRQVLHREWQIGLRLMHPHIVRVFEFHSEDPPYYTQQFVDGPDLGVLSGAPVGDVLPVIALIADALRYAHAKDVVHRDVKASNVLLDRNGAPYLIDFGVAAARGGSTSGGTLVASSPQQLDGEPAQPADDVFALGGLVYELVSGRSPYSPDSIADDIRHVIPKPLDDAAGDSVDPGLASLVAAMLDKDASARPDAASVAAALTELGFAGRPAPSKYVGSVTAVADEIVEAGEVLRPRSRTPRPAARDDAAPSGGVSPVVLWGSLAVLLLLLVGVVFLLPKTVRPTADAPPAVAGEQETAAPAADPDAAPGASGVDFSENVEDLSRRDERVQARAETEDVLGELLSKMDVLEKRAVQRWAGLRYKRAQAAYAAGDEAYLARNYDAAKREYERAIDLVEPLLDEVDDRFRSTLADAQAALDAADAAEALRLFELAVAISPDNATARAGYNRARNLDEVMLLTERGLELESDLELDAARQSLARAIEIDPAWEPARRALDRVEETIRQMDFDQRMTEGLTALSEGDYLGARAAFSMARKIKPGSPEPADGLLQVEQMIELDRIAALESTALDQVAAERWEDAVDTYESILELDPNLAFAKDGLGEARRMAALHARLDEYVSEPDSLSNQSVMQAATTLVVDITRMPVIGPRLAEQRDELARLLKRAATPLTVRILSDNATEVTVYKVGRLGTFDSRELELRPGSYTAVGSRPGYRDVRLEFRVAPEIDMEPVVVRCEEKI